MYFRTKLQSSAQHCTVRSVHDASLCAAAGLALDEQGLQLPHIGALVMGSDPSLDCDVLVHAPEVAGAAPLGAAPVPRLRCAPANPCSLGAMPWAGISAGLSCWHSGRVRRCVPAVLQEMPGPFVASCSGVSAG